MQHAVWHTIKLTLRPAPYHTAHQKTSCTTPPPATYHAIRSTMFSMPHSMRQHALQHGGCFAACSSTSAIADVACVVVFGNRACWIIRRKPLDTSLSNGYAAPLPSARLHAMPACLRAHVSMNRQFPPSFFKPGWFSSACTKQVIFLSARPKQLGDLVGLTHEHPAVRPRRITDMCTDASI